MPTLLKHNAYTMKYIKFCCCYLVTKLCPTLCDPMGYSIPGFAVLQYLPEFAQTHVHWINDAIQPSHSLSPISPFSLSFSYHQSFFFFSNESALCIRWPKYQSFSFNISPPNEYSGLISLRIDWFISLLAKGLSRVFSSTTVQKPQFFDAQPSAQ